MIQPNTLANKPTPKVTNTVSAFLVVKPLTRPDFNASLEAIAVTQAQAAQAAADALAAQQAEAAAQVVYTAPTAPTTYTQPADWYKAWIYNEESGNDPTKWNSSGCLGIGQACPASKLLAVCPNEDYGCEDAFFTQYMLARYGSWQAAYYFHLQMNWW